MATFPELSRGPGAKSYFEVIDPIAVQIGKKASGLPVLNKLFTFAGKDWKHTRYLVTQADKEAYLVFYEANKDIPFDWNNEQEDGTTYEVIFMAPPKCKLDRIQTRWKIIFLFRQYSPL